jgi:hypothetical protein
VVVSNSNGKVEDRMENTGQESRATPCGQFGQPEEQVAPPADLLAEQDEREDDDAEGKVKNAAAKART